MSYDLMVFEPSVAPREPEEFRAWYRAQTEWSEPHGYNDPSVTSPNLRKWYEAITRLYPNLNGPDVRDDDISDRHTDYSIGTQAIYAGFGWTQAEDAYDTVRRLAVENAVGFYDVSGDEGDGETCFPGDALRPPSDGAWRGVAAQFRELSKQTEQR
jgi:hypothetical protein